LLKTLLYRFLEPKTLKYFYGWNKTQLLDTYLKESCHSIALRLDFYKRAKLVTYLKESCHSIALRLDFYKRAKLVTKFNMKFLFKDMDTVIMNGIKNFVFQDAIYHNIEDNNGSSNPISSKYQDMKDKALSDVYSQIGKLKGVDFEKFKVGTYEPYNFEFIYPIKALSRDSKFTKILKEIKEEFIEGCDKLLYLTP
jgi:hypothetical protein